jgi:hypothetical protein
MVRTHSPPVVPAQAGTHNHDRLLLRRTSPRVPNEKPRRMGPGPVRKRALGRDDELSAGLRTVRH